MSLPEWIEVGRVSRAHGVRGDVRVTLSTDNPDRFVKGAVLHGVPSRPGLRQAESGRVTLEIESIKGMADSPIVKFAGVDDRTQAEGFRGWVLQVPLSELPALEDGEFYSFELEGLEARSLDGTVVGVVREVLESPAHDLLAIELSSGGEMLAPFIHEFVPVVEVESGYVTVDVERLRPADDD